MLKDTEKTDVIMLARAIFTIIATSLLADQVWCQSECDEYSILPHDGLRYVNNIITVDYDRFQDIYLQEGWYRSCEMMPETAPPDVLRCGTLFPIYLDGVHPDDTTAGDPPVDRTACLFAPTNPCKRTFDIQISYCSDGCYRYYLKPTYIDSSYCFGIGTEGGLTTYSIPRPTVMAELVDHGTHSETVFICDFVESTEEALVYKVHWYVDDFHHYDTGVASDSSDSALHITEMVFVQEGFMLGTELSCAVTAFTVENGPPSKRSPIANNFFAGIRVLTPSIEFDAHDDGIITIQPTIPIGCSDGLEDCKISIITYVPESYQDHECVGLVFRNQYCGQYIFSSNYSEVLNITVTANDNGHIHVVEQERYRVHLKTGDTLFNQIWSHYELPGIPVTITFGNAPTDARSFCRVLNDPHFTTFDGRYRAPDKERIFISKMPISSPNPMFDHLLESSHRDDSYKWSNIGFGEELTQGESIEVNFTHIIWGSEVQLHFSQCYHDYIRCLCGVAIRAGYDVYIWSLCKAVRMGYLYCADDGRALTVKTVNDREVRVTFNYGTYVRILQDGYFLIALVYPSTKDYFNTVGMCGTFDDNQDNDFHNLDGSSMGDAYHAQFPNDSYRSQPDDFVAIWRVTDESVDLFSNNFDMSTLERYDTNFCICENTTDDIAGTDTMEGTIPCTSTGSAMCQIGTLLSTDNCGFIDTKGRRRRRRSADGEIRELSTDERVRVPAVKLNNIYNNMQRAKREMKDDVAWTEETAREYCQKQFAYNKVYNLCTQVPSVNPDDNIDVCIMDIQLTNGTDWVYPNIHSMVQECYEELVRNMAIIQEEAKGNGDTIYDQIKKATCPNDCIEIGECVEGKCICPDGIGGSDCSVDLTLPVVIASLLDEGVCDKRTQDCSKTSIYGGAFADGEHLLCKVQEFEEDMSGSRTTLSDVHTTHPHLETFVELTLSFPALREQSSDKSPTGSQHQQSFVSGYSVMVTNDGKTFSESHDFYVYDSECQWADEVDGKFLFTLETGYCFMDGQCIVDGQVNKDDACYFCNSTLSPTSWSVHSAGYIGCRLQDVFHAAKGMKILTTVTIAALAIFTTLVVALLVMICFRPGGMLRNSIMAKSVNSIPEDKGTNKVRPISFKSKLNPLLDNCGETGVGKTTKAGSTDNWQNKCTSLVDS